MHERQCYVACTVLCAPHVYALALLQALYRWKVMPRKAWIREYAAPVVEEYLLAESKCGGQRVFRSSSHIRVRHWLWRCTLKSRNRPKMTAVCDAVFPTTWIRYLGERTQMYMYTTSAINPTCADGTAQEVDTDWLGEDEVTIRKHDKDWSENSKENGHAHVHAYETPQAEFLEHAQRAAHCRPDRIFFVWLWACGFVT